MEEQKLRSIRELAPKPSDAIKAMLDGLQSLSGDGFQVNMNTFGESYGEATHKGKPVCFGCAATFAVHWLAEKEPDALMLNSRVGRATYLGFSYGDLERFEQAIDAFRCGSPYPLFDFYGVNNDVINAAGLEFASRQPWHLVNSHWLSQLPVIKAYRARLVELGF